MNSLLDDDIFKYLAEAIPAFTNFTMSQKHKIRNHFRLVTRSQKEVLIEEAQLP